MSKLSEALDVFEKLNAVDGGDMSKDADILQMRMQIIGMSEDIHNYQAALTEKEAELDRLKAEITDLHHKSVCAYCGFTQTSKRPEDKLNDIAEHMAICDKHPIPKLIVEIMELKTELAAARGKIDKAKSILSMGHTQRERDAWEALKEAE